ncbi:MAG: SDR family NAD(P)-dependent oxidoreductase [Dehalococcoidia bacterium]
MVAGVGAALAAREAMGRLREADLAGQVALITGGSRGFGFLLARELSREGCRIAICARDGGELDRARRDLEQEGAEVLAIACDIADREQVQQMVEAITRRFGQIDLLINNAGIIEVGPVQTMTVEDFEQALGVMYWGVVYPTLAVLPAMRERRQGKIVTITSIGGKVSVPHLLPYGSAKFAAVGFSEGLRAELAGSGITVTTIVPGLMRTGSHLNASFKGQLGREFTWFSLGASLPLISMDAERAARQVVRAAKRGESERNLGLPATLIASVHGLFPGITSSVLGLVNRFVLPSAEDAAVASAKGMDVQAQSPSKLRDSLTSMGRSAAERFHEFSGANAIGEQR